MRRSLVLTSEAARHSFRASLPPHVCATRADEIEPRVPWRMRLGLDAQDARHFLATYCAGLLAVSLFIA